MATFRCIDTVAVTFCVAFGVQLSEKVAAADKNWRLATSRALVKRKDVTRWVIRHCATLGKSPVTRLGACYTSALLKLGKDCLSGKGKFI